MRRVAVLLLLTLASCNSEPSFDDRYNKAEQQIRTRASEIDNSLEAGEGAQR